MNNISIYVLPSEPHTPPRALLTLMETIGGDPTTMEELAETLEREGAVVGIAVQRTLATWSADSGMWLLEDGSPVPVELGEAITEHAKNLGVEW